MSVAPLDDVELSPGDSVAALVSVGAIVDEDVPSVVVVDAEVALPVVSIGLVVAALVKPPTDASAESFPLPLPHPADPSRQAAANGNLHADHRTFRQADRDIR